MSSPEERIEALRRAGVVAPGQAHTLLGAIGAGPDPWWKIVFDPFARHGGERAAAFGVVVSLAGLAASRLGIRFNGFFDMHLAGAAPAWKVALVDQLVAFPLGALVFWAVARIAGGRGRIVDDVGVVGVARFPTVLTGLAAWAVMGGSPGPLTGLRVILLVVPVLIGLGWTIALLYTGHANASGLRGPRLGLSLFAALVAAEIASKVALSLLF
jgi:Yip1 domain